MGRGNKRYVEKLKARLSQFTVVKKQATSEANVSIDGSCFAGISGRKLQWPSVHFAACGYLILLLDEVKSVPSLPAAFSYHGIYKYLPSAFLQRSDEGPDIKNTLQTKRSHV